MKPALRNRISWRRLAFVAACAVLSAIGVMPAGAPGDVGPSLMFPTDSVLQWKLVAGADDYNLYRGTAADGSDLGCLVFRTPANAAPDPDIPDSLFVYLVAAHNADGDGPLGQSSDGTPRIASVACADDDLDGVRDDQDNCPGIGNPSQADQDLDGRGDPCDPRTYDFEGDDVGTRPADVTQDGGVNATFLVRDEGGDLGVRYDGGTDVQDVFDRLPVWMPLQDVDVYVDTSSATSETLELELWSEGTAAEDAGTGIRLAVEPDGNARARFRDGATLTVLGSPAAVTGSDRLRLRLRKGDGTISRLSVDRWDGAEWVFTKIYSVLDDRRLIGRRIALAAREGGRRPLLRVTGVPIAPEDDLVLAKSREGLDDWKLFQRGSDGDAPIPVPFSYRSGAAVRLEVRVADQATALPLPGFDFRDQVFALDAAPDGAFDQVTIAQVPEGGNYDLEARLVDAATAEVLGQDSATDLAVGDVFLAAGQSNMAGYPGPWTPPEAPIPEVHLFGNDYVWKEGAEPMDSGVDQIDRVSFEGPGHSLMLRFGKEIFAATGVPVAIIPAPLAGTNLHTQWQRDDGDATNRGTLYGSSVHRVLAQGYTHPIRGVLWYQGESDMGRTTAEYRTDLEDLVADYRADLGNPGLFFGNCQLATHANVHAESWLAVQEAQRQHAEADPLAALVATVDQPRWDFVHLNVDGVKEVGSRLARAVLDGSYGITSNLGPQLQSIALGPGGNTIELTFDGPVSGGDSALFRVDDASGSPALASVSASGNVVTLTVGSPVQLPATLSYGFGNEPAQPWIVATDGSGAAQCFDAIPIND